MASGQLPGTHQLQIRLTVDYHIWGTVLEAHHKVHPKPKSITELKEALQVIWNSLLQALINKAVKIFTLRLKR